MQCRHEPFADFGPSRRALLGLDHPLPGGLVAIIRLLSLPIKYRKHIYDPNQFSARRTGCGGGDLGRLDALPIGEADPSVPPLGEQLLEGRPARLAPFGTVLGDLPGGRVAVGFVAADHAARPALGPADRVKPLGDPARLIEDNAARLVEGQGMRIFRPLRSSADSISLLNQPPICTPVFPLGKNLAPICL